MPAPPVTAPPMTELSLDGLVRRLMRTDEPVGLALDGPEVPEQLFYFCLDLLLGLLRAEHGDAAFDWDALTMPMWEATAARMRRAGFVARLSPADERPNAPNNALVAVDRSKLSGFLVVARTAARDYVVNFDFAAPPEIGARAMGGAAHGGHSAPAPS